MTKSFDEVLSNYKDPRPEWTVEINGKDYSSNLDLLEFTDSLNNALKCTVKLEGVDSSDNIPQDAELVVSRGGGELFRGVLKEVEPNMFNTYTFKATGYAAELEADSQQVVENNSGNTFIKNGKFDGATVQEVIDTLVDGSEVPNSKSFSTSFSGSIANTSVENLDVEDFRAKKEQLGDVNRLMGELDLEWYTTYDGSGQPVFNVTNQVSFTDSGNALDTLTTYGSSQTAEMIKQNVNRNKGDFDGVVVRGYGDGDDQVTATSGNTGKGNRVLFYTDKTILSDSQAQSRADNINDTNTVAWREIEVKPNDPNKLYGVGDELKIESEDARLNDTYRVVRSYFKIWPGEDQFESKLNLSNKPQTFVDDFKKQENQTDSQTDYMQGARNVWGDKEASNATSAEPLTIDFEVPQDVVNVADKNRLDRIEFNYACTSFRQSSDASDVQASNFDPGTKVVGTDMEPAGVEMERSNIKQHNHPVGSSTTSGAAELPFSETIEFQNEISSSGGWTRLTDSQGNSTLEIPNVEKDLSHELSLEVTAVEDSSGNRLTAGRDVQYAVISSSDSPTASFSYNPSSPVTGEQVEFVSTTSGGYVGSYHWVVKNSSGNTVYSDVGSSTSFSFASADDYDVTLQIYSEEGVGEKGAVANVIESTSNVFTVDPNLDSFTEVGDSIVISGSDGNDGVYTVQDSTVNASNEQEITVEEDIQYSYTDTTKTGNVEVFPEDPSYLTDSVTQTVSVISPSSLGSSTNENVVRSQEVTSQANTSIATGEPDEDSKRYVGNGPTITYDGSIDSDESGTLYLDVIFAGERGCGESYCFWQFSDVDSQDFFTAPSFSSYSLSYSFDDDLNFSGGPGLYSYRLRYEADDGTTQESFVFNQEVDTGAPTIYEAAPEITSPSDGAVIGSSDVTFDIEGPYGNDVQDNQELLIDGNSVDQKDIEGATLQIEEGGSETVTIDGEENTVEVVQAADTFAYLRVNGVLDTYNQGDTLSFDSTPDEDFHVTKTSEINDPDDRISGVVVLTSYLSYSHTETGISDGDHTATVRWDAANTNASNEVVEDSINFTIDTNSPPNADFSFSPNNPDQYETVSFTDESTDPDGDNTIDTWEWDFGNGDTQTIQSAPGDTTYTYNSTGTFTVTLTVTDDKGATNSASKDITVGTADTLGGETVIMNSEENLGGSPEAVDTSSLETHDLTGKTVIMGSSNNLGAQVSPGSDNYLANIRAPIPPEDVSEKYEVYVAPQNDGDSIPKFEGNLRIIKHNHTHDVPRQDDFGDNVASVGPGAENKEVNFVRSPNDRGDVLLDFSSNNEAVTLDTTLNGNDVAVTVGNIDDDGNITNTERIPSSGVVSNGTATSSNTYQDEELFVRIEKANNKDAFELRDQSITDVYTLAAAPEERFRSSNTKQQTDTVSGEGSEQDVVTDVSDGLLAGQTADNVKIYIDDDPDNDSTNSEQVITGDLYGGASDSGTAKDKGLDLSDYVDSPGWYRLKIEPNNPSFIKSRVFLDHHKDTE